VENAKSGTTSWILTNPAANQEIEGYASATSVNRGGQIHFYVNTTASSFTITVYRMGWYGGTGGRQVAGPVTVAGIVQPIPTPAPTTGLVECNWTKSYTLTTASDWTSGYYLAKLVATGSGKQSYIIFVVRDDASTSKYLVQSSVTTFQAYNSWGGKSLYSFNSSNGIAAVKVSFNRPYGLGINSASAPGIGAGEFLTNNAPVDETSCAAWEYNVVRFLEREGYDVTYCTDIDTHANGATLLPKHRAFLSIGHDEYWSWQMRDNVEAARDAGVSLGFFGANTCYWQIRFENDSTGAANRTEVGYKSSADTQDPYATDSDTSNDYLITKNWRDNSIAPPEDAFIGVMYVTDPVNTDLTIEDASHWICANTGLRSGDRLAGLLGYEVDCMFFNAPEGTGRVAHSSYTFGNGPVVPIEDPSRLRLPTSTTMYSDMTVYTADSGATVFATGSMQWQWALDDYNVPDLRPSYWSPAAQQITRNVLASFVGARPVVTAPPLTVTFSDNFNDNAMDGSKWKLGIISPPGGPGAWDTHVSAVEQNQQLKITPIKSNGSHYNGYVSVSPLNLTNAAASVEVVQTTDGDADTYLAVCVDSQNYYRIQKEGSLLHFAAVVAGATTETTLTYVPAVQHFWRIRHIQSTDSVVFETSPDGDVWTLRNSVPRQLSVTAMNLELGAGTNLSIANTGNAIFDNVQIGVTSNPSPSPTPNPTPTPSPVPTPTPAESVTAPTKPTGPTTGYVNNSYTFSTGGAVDNFGHSVQYCFDWGDGTTSGWLAVGTTSASKTWTTAATRTVKAQARCATHTTVISAYSVGATITINAESVTAPAKPAGPASGSTNVSYTYTTGSAVDNAGHSVQYLFDWGNGTNSGWLPVGTKSASKTWTTGGSYMVKAQARCATHTSIVSAYSTALTVTITAPETVSAPTKPSGPTTGKGIGTYTYTTGGAVDNLGHSVQYQFDWGDGSKSIWLAVGTTQASHNWGQTGTFSVKAQARCATHTTVVSPNSATLTVTLN